MFTRRLWPRRQRLPVAQRTRKSRPEAASCEAGLALSLILALYQKSKTLDIDFWSELREPELPSLRSSNEAAQRSYVSPAPLEYPRLTPAGLVPDLEHEHDPRLVDTARSQTAETPLQPPVAKEVIKSVSY